MKRCPVCNDKVIDEFIKGNVCVNCYRKDQAIQAQWGSIEDERQSMTRHKRRGTELKWFIVLCMDCGKEKSRKPVSEGWEDSETDVISHGICEDCNKIRHDNIKGKGKS